MWRTPAPTHRPRRRRRRRYRARASRRRDRRSTHPARIAVRSRRRPPPACRARRGTSRSHPVLRPRCRPRPCRSRRSRRRPTGRRSTPWSHRPFRPAPPTWCRRRSLASAAARHGQAPTIFGELGGDLFGLGDGGALEHLADARRRLAAGDPLDRVVEPVEEAALDLVGQPAAVRRADARPARR